MIAFATRATQECGGSTDFPHESLAKGGGLIDAVVGLIGFDLWQCQIRRMGCKTTVLVEGSRDSTAPSRPRRGRSWALIQPRIGMLGPTSAVWR
jgi:hypothetical protein